MTRAFVVVAVAAAVAGAAQASGNTRSFRSPLVSFLYPASWHLRHGTVYPDGSARIVWLTNTRLGGPCLSLLRTRCGELPRGGVIATWALAEVLDPMPARFVTVRPGPCKSIGGDETILHTYADDWEMVACIRSPGIAAADRRVRAMLGSARSRLPS